jgi:uncharacterized protein YhjY with autotransporter beta-barrel domain
MIGAQAAFAAITLTPSSLPAGTLGVVYDETVIAGGGTGPYTFAVMAGALPPGIALDGNTGNLTGTPSAQGVYTFTLTATDSLSATGSRSYTLSIGTFSLAVQPNTVPNGILGVAYNQTLTAVGGTPPYTFTVSSGSLPTGVSLASDGTMSGTPSAGGTFTFIVMAEDNNGNSGFRTYVINIGTNSLSIAPASLPNGTQGTAYNQTVTASGGAGAPYTYSISAGSLPSGLTLDANTGAITGTPSAGGSFNFTVRAVDATNNFGTRAYAVTVGANSLVINPGSLPSGTVGTGYSRTVTASGGTGGPYTYSIGSGALPTGLSLNSGSGAITGTPSAGGVFTFTIHAVDGNGNFGNANYTVSIGINSLAVTPASLPNGTQGISYNQTVAASGGTAPYSFAVTSGALPSGLSLNAGSGTISGTPSATGPSNFTVLATDVNGNTGSRAYSITISPPPLTVNPATLPNGTQGVAYNQTVSANGGTGPYTFTVLSGALPAGLTLNGGSGAISGTPTGSGVSNFTIQATDATSNTGTRAYSVSIGTVSLTVNPGSLPNGTQGAAYAQTVSASGGTGPYTFGVSSGALPAGLTLNAGSGAVSGTPTGSGVSNFTIQATDANGNTGSRGYAVNIGTNTLTVNPASLPNGSQGVAYAQTVLASGGTGPYTFAVSSGALPAGLTLNAGSGAITGTPSGGGVSNFTVRATDSNGNTGSRSYAVNIGTGTLTVNPASLPNGSLGFAYNQTVTANGGTGPYVYTLVSGLLPPGLALNSGTGAVSGTPTGNGSSTFTFRATDANGNIGLRTFTVNIGGNSLTINPSVLPPAPLGKAYSQTLTVVGGTAPFTFALQSGSLPPGLSISPGGVISGTPTREGSFTLTLLARDPNGSFGTRSYALSTVRNDPSKDPEVRGMVAAQAATARRFTDAQTTNVMRRLETLHDGFDPCRMNFGLVASTPGAPAAPFPAQGMATAPVNKDPFPSASLPAPSPAPPSPACDPLSGPPIAVWASGAIEFGKMNNAGLVDSTKFTTSGVTAGIDARISDQLIVGGAVGFGADRSDIGLRGSVSDANSVNGVFYASYKPIQFLYVDALAGYGTLNFDNKRLSALDGSALSGKRGGNAFFASLGLHYDIRMGAIKFTPYARLDTMKAGLNQYSESGDASQALTFRATNFSTTAGVVGLRGSVDIRSDDVTYTPNMRVEYKRALDRGFSQSMFYSEAGVGQVYALDQNDMTRDIFSGGLGIRARIGSSATLEVEYSLTGTPSRDLSWQSQMIRAMAHWNFEAN